MKTSFRQAFFLVFPFTLIAVTFLTGGCDQDKSSDADTNAASGSNSAAESAPAAKSTVGIVDLDEVAQELGLSSQFKQIVTSQQMQLQDQLNNVILSMRSNLESKNKEFGENPTDEQKNELQQLQALANQRIGNMQAQAQQQTGQLQQSLAEQIRAMIKGPLEKVAKQRGLSLVLVKQNNVFYSAEGIDITAAVISAAREDGVSKLNTEGIATDGSSTTKPPAAEPEPTSDDDAPTTDDEQEGPESSDP